ncbi:MAG: hypothetical protein ACXWWJ_02810 [Nitrospira sp.]
MKLPGNTENDDMNSEEESDLSPEDQETQDKKNYDEHLKKPAGNYL